MADAISIISLVAITVQASKQLYELIDAAKHAPNEVQDISKDSKATYEILGLLEGFLQNNEKDTVPMELLRSLQIPLDNMVKVLQEMVKKLKPYIKLSGDAKASKWVGFRWALSQTDVKLLRDKLINGKATLNMLLGAITM